MKQLLTGIICIILGGCTQNKIYQDSKKDALKITAEDSSIGFFPVQTKVHDTRFEIGFSVPPISVKEAEKFLVTQVIYDGFSEIIVEEVALIFKGILPDNVPFAITLKNLQKDSLPTDENVKQQKKIKDLYKSLLVPSITFLIKKEDFEQLIKSKEIKYIFTSREHNISGDFDPDSLDIIQRNGKALLSKKPYKPQTFDEMKKDIDDINQCLKQVSMAP